MASLDSLRKILQSDKRHVSFGSIRSRFILIIMAISLPSIGLVYYHSQFERELRIKNAILFAEHISDQVVQSQARVIEESKTFLQNLAQEPVLQRPASNQCNIKLASLLRLNTEFINIGAPLANGDLLCNAMPLRQEINVSDREYIQRAITNKAFSMSNYQIDRVTGEASINFAYPIMVGSTDTVLALAVVVKSLGWWSDELNNYQVPAGSTAVITDSENKIIANFPYDREAIGSEFMIPNTQFEENIFIAEINNVRKIFCKKLLYQANEKDAVNFIISIPVEQDIKAANRYFYRSLLIFLSLFSVVFVCSLFNLNRSIVIPIRKLIEAINNLEYGKKTELPEGVGAKEIQLLNNQFARMAETRLKAEKASISRSKELHSVFTALPDTYIRITKLGEILDFRDGNDGENNYKKIFIGLSINDFFEKSIADLFYHKIKFIDIDSKPWEYTQTLNDTKIIFEARITKIHNSRELVIIIRDITERKKSEEAIWRHANFDTLTNLPNRKYFYEKLSHLLTEAKSLNQHLALLFIDLDRFKEVNDTLGHHVGDILLKEVASRLLSCVRKTDIVARLGGDEFTIIINDFSNVETVDLIAEKILKEVNQAIDLEGKIFHTSPSIGISFFPDDGDTVDELIKTADQAMFAAKNSGRNRFNHYESKMQEQAIHRLNLMSDLRPAIDQEQFHLVYQPIIEVKTKKIKKVEALIRWAHPEKGYISPNDFIPLAEENELIFPIGNWLINEVENKIDYFIEHFGDSIQMCINISPLQFMNHDPIKNFWFEKINELSLKHNIVLEITEGLIMDASEETERKFEILATNGISIAIDDFGTGYSSLAYINQYDIDLLKIDRSFVMNVREDASNLALYEAIIAMAHKLDIEVVAEGVETLEQLELLEKMNCDYAQGYFFSKPRGFDDLIQLGKQFTIKNGIANYE